jgi:hypothetical protein
MADKLHTLTSNIIKFSAGEKPSADKFNAANEYFARSLRDISKAIGDIRDQGYPHVSDANKYTHLTGAWNPYEPNPEGRPLDIVNLARLIGPASNLNPKMLKFDKLVAESISGLVMEYTLAYPYNDGSFSAGGGAVLTRVETDYFTGTNQFRVSNGIIYFSNTTPGGVNRSLIYETSSEGIFGGPNYEGASFNVIPDPNQPSKLSVVALANEVNAYSIDLGNCTHQQSGIKSKDSLLLSSLNAGEFNNGVELKLPGWMWEGDLPRFENGDSIPEGFLVVKNLTTNEVYQNANYYFISPTEIHIKGVSLCVDHEFCVITVGTDITTSIDDLRNKLHLHKHDGSFGEGRISVKSLIDKFSEYSSVVYGESSIPNNHFPMYLHRSGFSLDSNLNNGNNAMLGTLLMGATSFNSLSPIVNTVIKNSPTLETTEGYQSQPILFTSPDCAIYREDSADLKITNSNYKAINVEAGGINLEAMYGINLHTPKILEGNGEAIELDTQNILSYSSDQTQINSGRLIRIISEESIETQSNKFEIEIKEKAEEEEYFKAYVNALDSDNDGSIILNKEKVELKQNNIDILSDNIILESKAKDTKYYNISETLDYLYKRGLIVQKVDSNYLKETYEIDQKISTTQNTKSFFDSVKVSDGRWAEAGFLDLLDDEEEPSIFNTFDVSGFDKKYIYNYQLSDYEIVDPYRIFIRSKNYLFEALNNKNSVFQTTSFDNEEKIENITAYLLQEEVDFKFLNYEMIGNFLENDREVYNTTGNKNIIFQFQNFNQKNKKSLIINKSDYFTADFRISGTNYLVRFDKPKYVHFKMHEYNAGLGTEYKRNVFVEAGNNVNLLELCFNSVNSAENLFQADAPVGFRRVLMNDIRFEVEIIENLNDAIVNITGRYVNA